MQPPRDHACCDDNRTEGGCGCQDRGRPGGQKRGELLGLLRPYFVRAGPWLQAGKYIGALVSDLPKRNGWTIAQQAGDRAPQRTQRLLNRACWDTFAAMGTVRRFAVAGLDEAACRSGRRRGLRTGAIDETGQRSREPRPRASNGSYLGCAGRVANGITTVHLSYVRERTGHALIGARQWIPAEHLDDPVTSLVMGLPGDLVFRTKGQLAIDICTEALADGATFDFLCGDEVYGAAPNCAASAKAAVRGMCCGSGPPSGSRWRRGVTMTCAQAVALAAQRHAPLGDPLRRDRLQGPALVCLGVAGHRLPAALAC